MSKKRRYSLIALGALIISAAWLSIRHEAEPLVSGKPVAYWLDSLPPGGYGPLLPEDNPLVQAGPEIVPSLIAAIDKSRTGRDFIDRYRRRLPPFLQRLL